MPPMGLLEFAAGVVTGAAAAFICGMLIFVTARRLARKIASHCEGLVDRLGEPTEVPGRRSRSLSGS